MKYIAALLLSGCTSFGSNVDHVVQQESKSEEKIQAAMAESRQSEAPQPVSITVTASGNASVNAAVPDLPMKRDRLGIEKSMTSDSWADTTLREAWSKFSGWVYVLLAFAAWLAVRALKSFEGTVTGRTLGGLAETLRYKLQETDRADPEHKVLTSVLHEINNRTGRRKP
jgi:hypothetical protein